MDKLNANIVKKIKETLKEIQKKKSFDIIKIARDRDEIYFDENEEAWQVLGLSLKKKG